MPEPVWNVVVIGAWNRAILTPDGIRRRLFRLPEGTPIQVEVAVDRPADYRVRHDDVVVIPHLSRLEAVAGRPELALLERACQLCQTALESLPETPVSAVGVNIRYGFERFPAALYELVRAPIDDSLSDADFVIEGSTISRALTVRPGVLNLQISHSSDGSGLLDCNFHLSSVEAAELREWLGRVGEFHTIVERARVVLGVAQNG